MTDLTPDHPAVEAAMKSTALDTLLIDLRPRLDRRKRVAHLLARFITAALPHLTADDLRATPAGQALMAEAWSKFQEHYAAEWEEAYPEDIFPSPAPPPAVVSRESVAASMMRKWAKNLRSDHNPFEEDDQ